MKTHLKQTGLTKWLVLSFMSLTLSFFMMGCGDSKKQVTSVDKADQNAGQGNAGNEQGNAGADQDDAGNDQDNAQADQGNAEDGQNVDTAGADQGNAEDGQNVDTAGADQGNAEDGQNVDTAGADQGNAEDVPKADLTNPNFEIELKGVNLAVPKTVECTCYKERWYWDLGVGIIQLTSTEEELEAAVEHSGTDSPGVRNYFEKEIDELCQIHKASDTDEVYGELDSCSIVE